MNDEVLLSDDSHELPVPGNGNKSIEGLYEWVEAAVFSLTLVVLIFSFLFRIVGVDGNSMNPTLKNGERLIITNLMYTPKQGDIVIINRYTQEPLVKRVIAVAGDTLEINGETNQVIVNGKVLAESYTKGLTYPLYFQPTKQVVPDGCVFVMGDNREDSMDSRFPEVGFIHTEDIMGKAVYRFLPISRFGSLY